MSEYLFSKSGRFLGAATKRMMAFVSPVRRSSVLPTSDWKFVLPVGGKEVEFVCWGAGNDWPEEGLELIGGNNVLQTGLNFKVRVGYGQGIVPTRLRGLTAEGEEDYEIVNDRGLIGLLRGYGVRNCVQGALRDLHKLGNTVQVLTMSDDGQRILNVETLNMRHVRLSTCKRWVALFPDYGTATPGPGDKKLRVLPMLDEFDPWTDLQVLRATGRLGKGGIRQVCFPRLKNYFSNNDYYALPDWWSAKESGWLDVAAKVPKFLRYAYANAMSMMWHVNIPESFLDVKFPQKDYINNIAQRDEDIKDWLRSLEESLCGEENAMKTLITIHASKSENGVESEPVEIKRLDNEIEAKEQLTTSSAANSEILFALMVNPSVMGAGMPGGSYAGNAGSGSDIRESALISIVLAHIEKEQVLEPVETMLRYNGWEDLELKFRRTILTTLNTGNAVAEGIS